MRNKELETIDYVTQRTSNSKSLLAAIKENINVPEHDNYYEVVKNMGFNIALVDKLPSIHDTSCGPWSRTCTEHRYFSKGSKINGKDI